MTPLKVIAAGISGLLLIPVLVIGAVAGGFGGAPSVDPSTTSSLAIGELEVAVLEHPAIHLTANAKHDVEAGVVDARVLQVLLVLADGFELGPVGPLISGHSHFVKGTSRVSNHVYGRAVDILGVNGAPVSPTNSAARDAMQAILGWPDSMQPDELGGPWILHAGARSTFTNADHQDHIHAGWDS